MPCRATTVRKIRAVQRQIPAGGPLDRIHPITRTAPLEQTCGVAQAHPSTGHKARRIAEALGTATFLALRVALRHRTPSAEDGSALLRSHVPPILRSRQGVHWTTVRTVPTTTARMATALTAEVIRDRKAHILEGPDTPANRVVIRGLL